MTEIKVQISDGLWDGVTPHDHWSVMCRAKAFVAEEPKQLGLNFEPKCYYDFARVDLINVVGDRMIGYVKWYSIFYYLDPEYKLYNDTGYVSSLRDAGRLLFKAVGTDEFWVKKLQELMALHAVSEPVNLIEIAQKVTAVPYDMMTLWEDLNLMTKTMHSRQNRSHQ
jgi:hypothetical protein